MNIYIIDNQNSQKPETLFSAGLKALLQHTGKYEVGVIPFAEIKTIIQASDFLLLFLWTKGEEPRILDRINTIRTTGGMQQPILVVIDQYGIDNQQVKQLIAFGRLGIVSTCISRQELFRYIDNLHNENRTWVLSGDIQAALLDHLFISASTTSTYNTTSELSEREQQILNLTQRGYSIDQIAETLILSKNTVANYRRKMMKKVGVRSMAELLEKQWAMKRI